MMRTMEAMTTTVGMMGMGTTTPEMTTVEIRRRRCLLAKLSSEGERPEARIYNPNNSRTYFTGGLPKERTLLLYFLRSKEAPALALARSRISKCSVTPTK
jgi:hypothetical protein